MVILGDILGLPLKSITTVDTSYFSCDQHILKFDVKYGAKDAGLVSIHSFIDLLIMHSGL